MVWGALIGAAVSAWGASRSRSQQRDASRSQQEAMRGQTELLQGNVDFARDRYAQWEQLYAPLFERMMGQLDRANEVDYSGVVGDATAAFDSAVGQSRRQAERYGINPADGATAGIEERAGLGRAASIVDGMNTQRMANRDREWNMTGELMGMTTPLLASATGMYQGAVSGLAGAMGGQANMYGNQAQQAGLAVAQGWNDASRSLGSVDWGAASNRLFGNSASGSSSQYGPYQSGYRYNSGVSTGNRLNNQAASGGNGYYRPPTWGGG
jgi:hypothetical protein